MSDTENSTPEVEDEFEERELDEQLDFGDIAEVEIDETEVYENDEEWEL